MSNKMTDVAKLLGVEIGEEFDIEGSESNPYHLYQGGLRDCDGLDCNYSFAKIITGEFNIIKKPFRPKEGKWYYYVNESGYIDSQINQLDAIDLSFIHIGNCFKSEVEAENHKDEVLKKFDDIRKELK